MYTTNPLKPHKSSAVVFKRSLPVLYLFMYASPLYGVYLVSKDNVPSNTGMPGVLCIKIDATLSKYVFKLAKVKF